MKKTVRKTVAAAFDGIKAGIFIKTEMEASSALIKRLKKSEDGIKINGKERIRMKFCIRETKLK